MLQFGAGRPAERQIGVFFMKTWTIYRHVNKINGKCYVGITCRRWVKCRWGSDGHGYNQPGQKKFWAAIVKYGWNNFDHEILEKGIHTPEEANEREKFWIAHFDSFKHGYNGTIGGSGATGHEYNEEARRKNSEAHKGLKCHNMPHSEETKKLLSKTHKGLHNSPRTEFKKGNVSWLSGKAGTLGKPVLQYDAEGNFVKEWANIFSVVDFFGGTSQSCIRQCCKGNRKRYKNSIWRFKENDDFPKTVKPQELIDVRVPVLQYDLNGNFIAEYESTIEAYRRTGTSRGGIRNVCIGKYKQANGYVWKYKK